MSSLFNQRSRIEGLAAQQAAETKASKITNRHEQPRHAITTANRAEVNDQMWNRMVQTLPSTEDPAGVHYANTGTCSGRDCAATITGRTSSTGGAMAFSAALNSINASQPATVDTACPPTDRPMHPAWARRVGCTPCCAEQLTRRGFPGAEGAGPVPGAVTGRGRQRAAAVRGAQAPLRHRGARDAVADAVFRKVVPGGDSLRQPVDLPQYSVPSGQTVNEPRAGPPAWC